MRTLALQLPGQLSFFMIGALIHYHQKLFYKYGWWLMAGAAALFALHEYTRMVCTAPRCSGDAYTGRGASVAGGEGTNALGRLFVQHLRFALADSAVVDSSRVFLLCIRGAALRLHFS